MICAECGYEHTQESHDRAMRTLKASIDMAQIKGLAGAVDMLATLYARYEIAAERKKQEEAARCVAI
jgi:hypothetical protein